MKALDVAFLFEQGLYMRMILVTALKIHVINYIYVNTRLEFE